MQSGLKQAKLSYLFGYAIWTIHRKNLVEWTADVLLDNASDSQSWKQEFWKSLVKGEQT